MGYLSRWAVRKPVIAIIAWFALLIVIGVLGGRFGGDLKDSFELPGTESQVAQNLLAETAGADATSGATASVVWGVESGSVEDASVKQTVVPLMEKFGDLPGVSCVTSPYGQSYGPSCPEQPKPDPNAPQPPPEIQAKIDKAKAAAAVATSPISKDGKVAYSTIVFDGLDVPSETASTIIDDVEAANGTNDVAIGANGQVLAFAGQEPPSGEAIGILVAIIILLIAFGSAVAAGLPIVTAVFGLGAGLSLVTFTASFFTVATFAPTLAAMIGLGVGIDYALFILNRFRQAVMAGHAPKDAALESVNTAGRAVQFAGTTVIIALLGLFVLGIGFFNGLAVAASLTVAMVMLSAVWLLPALLSLLGEKALGLRMPWARSRKEWHPEGGKWAHYGRVLQRRPWLYTLAAAALVVVLAIPYFSIRLGFPDDSGQPQGSPARIAYDLTAEGFGPGANGPFFLAVQLPYALDEDSLTNLIEDLNATEGVARTVPTVDMVPISVTPNQTITAIQVVPTTSPQDPATDELLKRLRDETIPAAEQNTTMRAYVGGTTAVTADFTTVLSDSLPVFLAVVVGLGFVALTILFRSLIVPLIGAVTSLLSLGAALGVTVAIFQWGWGASLIGVTATGPILPFLPIMVFAILFGLSMDYQVFLVSRMHEEWSHTKDNALSVRRGLAGSGRVVAIAAAIMSSVFLAFIPTPEDTIKLFGVGLATAVLVDAFIIRLILVPSLISWIGPPTWWLPKWLGFLPEVHMEAEGSEDEIVDDDPELVGAK
ncbi:MAG: MMPL family transporter [Candidatus Nanopelagicales bacterium]|nr:MMPL family transporter [Candidatus Nanopelagicales bacterium]HPE11948.1 MMPL family transporter [Actinomycetota bacterium]HRV65707.1 MMPL family transporter [Candidatus Nanopelagicales bacterium]